MRISVSTHGKCAYLIFNNRIRARKGTTLGDMRKRHESNVISSGSYADCQMFYSIRKLCVGMCVCSDVFGIYIFTVRFNLGLIKVMATDANPITRNGGGP